MGTSSLVPVLKAAHAENSRKRARKLVDGIGALEYEERFRRLKLFMIINQESRIKNQEFYFAKK